MPTRSSLAFLFPLLAVTVGWSSQNPDELNPAAMYKGYCRLCAASPNNGFHCMCSGNSDYSGGITGPYNDDPTSYDWTSYGSVTKSCMFAPYPGMEIIVDTFSVQAGTGACENDYLEIDGKKYCDNDNPLNAGDKIANPTGAPNSIKFVVNNDGTKGSAMNSGFKICQAAMPPAAPPSPAPPGELCLNTCKDKDGKAATSGSSSFWNIGNSWCDDGGKWTYSYETSDYDSSTGQYVARTVSTEYATDNRGLNLFNGPESLGDPSYPYGCQYGTDCKDCGPRYVCQDCEQSCRERSGALGHGHTCWTDRYNNGFCDVECNNWECGHDGDDCTDDDALRQCIIGHNNKAQTSKPALITDGVATGTNSTSLLAPVELRLLTAEPLSLSLNSESNSWQLGMKAEIGLIWRDSRMKALPCTLFLEQMLSLDITADDDVRTAKYPLRSIVWYPQLMVEGQTLSMVTDPQTKKKSIDAQDFKHWPSDTAPKPWTYPPPDLANTTGNVSCIDCVGINISVVHDFVAIPTLFFGSYPFDHQVLRFKIAATGADFYNCADLFTNPNDQAVTEKDLLPASGEWNAEKLVGVPKYSGTGTKGNPSTMSCEIQLHARRNFLIFILKQLLPSVLVVYTGLLSMYLNAADHTGDRIAAILVSILILMVNFQANLGIGKITYLVWWDTFNLISMGVLTVCLIEALYEHNLMVTGREERCLITNKVLRIAFCSGIYPCILIWLLLYGLQGITSVAAWVILIGGNALVVVASLMRVKKMMNDGGASRDEVVTKLQNCDLTSNASLTEAISYAFETFDVDKSGKLDLDEVRELLTHLFSGRQITNTNALPKHLDLDKDGTISSYEFANLLLAVKTFADMEGSFTLKMLLEALNYAMHPKTNETAAALASNATVFVSKAGEADALPTALPPRSPKGIKEAKVEVASGAGLLA